MYRSFVIAARPSASVFVWENVSIGGTLLFQYRDASTRYVFPPGSLDPNAISSFMVDTSGVMYGIAVGIGGERADGRVGLVLATPLRQLIDGERHAISCTERLLDVSGRHHDAQG